LQKKEEGGTQNPLYRSEPAAPSPLMRVTRLLYTHFCTLSSASFCCKQKKQHSNNENKKPRRKYAKKTLKKHKSLRQVGQQQQLKQRKKKNTHTTMQRSVRHRCLSNAALEDTETERERGGERRDRTKKKIKKGPRCKTPRRCPTQHERKQKQRERCREEKATLRLVFHAGAVFFSFVLFLWRWVCVFPLLWFR
jgi:hypothetical protein